MEARKRVAGYAILLGLALGSVQADFAPLKIGNRWAYEGSISMSGGFRRIKQLLARERLTLEILSQRQSGDTSLYLIKMRDSLSARKWWTSTTNGWEDQQDTVLSQVVKYASLRDSVFQLPAAIDSGIVVDSSDIGLPGAHFSVFRTTLLLNAHRSLSGQPQVVPGSDPAKRAFSTQHLQNWFFQWTDWYVDDVGAFFEQLRMNGECGPYLTRSLYLAQFNGKEVSIGVTPPGWPLAKEGVIACSLARVPSSRLRIGFIWRGTRTEADLSGRIFHSP